MLSSSSPARRAFTIQRCSAWRSGPCAAIDPPPSAPGHEGPDAGAGAGQSLVLQLPVGLQHRVGVDGQLADHLLDRRQLVAFPQQAQAEGLADLLDDLEVGGDARTTVQVELDHVSLTLSR